MHPLGLLLVVAAAAGSLARPPINNETPALTPRTHHGPLREPHRMPTLTETIGDIMLPQYILPNYVRLREEKQPSTRYDWLTREIARLNLMEAAEEALAEGYEDIEKREDLMSMLFDLPPDPFQITEDAYQPLQAPPRPTEKLKNNFGHPSKKMDEDDDVIAFGYTPFEKGFFSAIEEEPPQQTSHQHSVPQEVISKIKPHKAPSTAIAEQASAAAAAAPAAIRKITTNAAGSAASAFAAVDASAPLKQRQIRQNPNLSRTKTLVAENLDKLRSSVPNKDYRVPVSLLPTNLRWLKISHSDDRSDTNNDEERTGNEGVTPHHHIHVEGHPGAADPAESMYGVAVIAAVSAALAVAVIGFAFGWYTLSKKAKAAADVDYPAYGVTGPSADTTGDRKLAHSAHMYHYQHQKQQILAMERSGTEGRKGSISDPESEEENEEGDYTVYECPGFATTGDMEVKNPMFSEDPSPATPGKVEVAKVAKE